MAQPYATLPLINKRLEARPETRFLAVSRTISPLFPIPKFLKRPFSDAPLARFSHQFLGTGFEDTENLDGGPAGMLGGVEKGPVDDGL